MAIPILTTKLYIPTPRPNLVARPGLIAQLEQGFAQKLTLISASAGFGKTTLVSVWIAHSRHRFAWLSLDRHDKEPARFMAYVTAAIQTLYPDFGRDLLNALVAEPALPAERWLTPLINELALIEAPFALVLDDYHVLDSQPIDDILSFLLDHLPPQMHLVITTREDPPFSLSRMRVRGELTEVRTADLRFSAEESAHFLNRTMSLDLPADQVGLLENRTEGWVAVSPAFVRSLIMSRSNSAIAAKR